MNSSACRAWAIINENVTNILCNTAIIPFLMSTRYAGLDLNILAEVLLLFNFHSIIYFFFLVSEVDT